MGPKKDKLQSPLPITTRSLTKKTPMTVAGAGDEVDTFHDNDSITLPELTGKIDYLVKKIDRIEKTREGC